ncbi:DUF2157 domain-containing protein [Pontibacter sp. E15-1]|uniref:DUF2157 domain-containing protein n=1 Tax=Pontibacter sp. E15-1 TaxID=2919918 RepID=UPI001F4FCF4C|nr:DUF2157 domain-containing protein [Pontibacter sp. E15-1]MCJ8165503.1 DUF2157 domain-containing protein [Pontibacter sp. E15-1]
MKPLLTRELLYSIARHSNWRPGSLEATFRSAGLYASPRRWALFAQLLLLGAGASFLVAGVVFFFAYNWAAMHKFLKLGLLQALVVGITGFALFAKGRENIRNLLLTGSTVLVGVLFAVFGQVYQTGANAYNFFLGWTGCVALWVLVAQYPPLWLIFLALLNTTLVLYTQQVATHWPAAVLLDLLFVLNGGAVLVWEWVARKKRNRMRGKWLQRLAGLAAVMALTSSLVVAIFTNLGQDKGLCLLLAALGYGAGLWQGQRVRDLFYLSVIPFGGIVVGTALLVRATEYAPDLMLLLASLFVIGTTTLLVRYILHVNRQWYGK